MKYTSMNTSMEIRLYIYIYLSYNNILLLIKNKY